MKAPMPNLNEAQLRRMVQALAQAQDCADLRILETHISWILLCGPWAWKFKKPVNFGFLDFSTPALRRRYCEEEVRLNRRTAPNLYKDVQEIRGCVEAPHIGGSGDVLAHAVRMRRFDSDQTLDHRLARGELTASHVDAAAAVIAHFHARAAIAAAASEWGGRETVARPVAGNFRTLRKRLSLAQAAHLGLDDLERRVGERGAQLAATFADRKRQGCIRECHGDLHLGNLALIDGVVTAFDALEFNPELRWIDTASDMGFLVMDLAERGRVDLSRRCLSQYLEHRPDWDALAVLPYYQSYRALVRAKVAALRGPAGGADGKDIAAYVEQAQTCLTPPAPALYLTHGVSGSGKSTAAMARVEAMGAVRVRSDVERKRLFPEIAGRYTPEAGRRTYARLLAIADGILACGYPVVVDAAFLEREQRAPFLALARKRHAPVRMLDLHAPIEVLRRRIRERLAAGRDVSEATLAVLEGQMQRIEPLTTEERAVALVERGGSGAV